MSIEHSNFSNTIVDVTKTIQALQIAFIDSDTKGLMFWKSTLLPDNEENAQINDDIYQILVQTFNSTEQIKEVVINLKTLREQCLNDERIRKMVEEIYNQTLNLSSMQVLIDQSTPIQDDNNF